jgi:hypothetical protein
MCDGAGWKQHMKLLFLLACAFQVPLSSGRSLLECHWHVVASARLLALSAVAL